MHLTIRAVRTRIAMWFDGPPIDPEMYRRVEGDCLKLCRALGYDLNTVEFAVEDGIPYAIDFLNPGARRAGAASRSVKKNFDFDSSMQSRSTQWKRGSARSRSP